MGTSGYKNDNSKKENKGINKDIIKLKRKKRLKENNQDIENKINFEDLDKDYKEQFKCNYESTELQEMLSKYIDTINIQDTFFTKTSYKDKTFDLLKEKEKNDLTQFFQSTLSQMRDFLKNENNLKKK